MNKHEETLLHEYLKDIQRLSHYPILVADPHSENFFLKSGGTKQGVYTHMVFIRNKVDYVLKEFFDEEWEDGQQ